MSNEDVLYAIDNIMHLTDFQPNIVVMIRHLVTLFVLTNNLVGNLDFHQIIFKVRTNDILFLKYRHQDNTPEDLCYMITDFQGRRLNDN